jgi:HAD superfamily hydrolase (TIGR01484 family)
MRYHILAADYDGTIALHGKVNEKTIEALKDLKASARKLILVTGRELDELKEIFPQHTLFDLIVAENGALIYEPSIMKEYLLGEAPPPSFVEELKKLNVKPLSVGRVIIATWEPHENDVLEAIKRAGIEHQVIFNKGAVMVLPPGVNKATGLQAALQHIKFSFHNLVAVGDAENDNAMLQVAECSVAVANALQSVKDLSAFVTKGDHGAGVEELINHLLKDDFAEADKYLQKHYLPLGKDKAGNDFKISPYRDGMLLVGSSGGGKSTFTSAFLENLIAAKYQFCLIDPEGDYLDFPDTVIVGDAEHEPLIEEIIKLLENPEQNIIICTLSIALDKRPAFFNSLLPHLIDLRNRKAHPHWIILDEANHLLPRETEPSFFNIPHHLKNFLLITTQPVRVNLSIMKHIDAVVVVGDKPAEQLKQYASIKSLSLDSIHIPDLEKGEALIWEPMRKKDPAVITHITPKQLTKRHIKKYAAGTMDYNNFYFKGPEGKLNLKAYNVIVFMQLAEGVDDDTWMFHLKRHDYSNWFRDALHDNELADLAKEIETKDNQPKSSKEKILKLVVERYTLPE